MIRIFFVSILLITSLACKHETPVKVYPMKGVIVKVDLLGKSASINAEKIDGWMEAMTMDYPVHDSKLLEGIKPGDHITASVHVPEDLNYWIDNIKVVQAVSPDH